MSSFLLVALGGGLGAAARYAMTFLPWDSPFPLKTLLTNLLGAVLIGFIVGLSRRTPALGANATLFWKTGVCGGFTTFSTFSLETITLLEAGDFLRGGGYLFASVALCLAGVCAGQWLAARLPG